VYGRIGTTTTEFGTTASWLVDVINVLTGNLDRPGGSMFPLPVAGGPTTRGVRGTGAGFRIGRGRSRVSGHPEVAGEFPAGDLAEEILVPGAGQIRCLITVGGNPLLSTPNSTQLADAFADLEFMVSIDMYLNETTRFADVVLPVPSQLQRSHYDVLLLQFAVRNVANYSEAVLPLEPGELDEWEVMAKLALIAQGLGVDADVTIVDDLAVSALANSVVGDPASVMHGRDADELIAAVSEHGRRGPERLLDLMLRSGPFGEGCGADPGGASLDALLANPHGVDYGALTPRLPEILRTPSGKIELGAPELIGDLERLAAAVDGLTERELVLVGRRHIRSNNSWMHNIEVLMKGKPRCTLHVHPDDAVRLGLTDGGSATIASRVGSVLAPVEVTDAIRPGVVSLPHGWGHGQPGTRMRVAAERAGVNSNVLADQAAMDPLSGTAVLNGIPVVVSPT
jgi:anaerobic selenocysteine-containing dehydrogenase